MIAKYDWLVELASEGKERAGQKSLHDYLGKNRDRYLEISFKKDNVGKSEDSLTKLRNKIAHAEQKNDYADYADYASMEEKVTPNAIRMELRIINDILCEESKKARG